MRNILMVLAAALPLAAQVKPVPPPGVAVPAADRAELEAGLTQLQRSIEPLRVKPLLPDVEIYYHPTRGIPVRSPWRDFSGRSGS